MTFLTFSCCQLFYLHRTIDRQSLEANFHVFARHSNALDRQENKSTTNFAAFSSDRKWKTYKASIFFFFGMCGWRKKKKIKTANWMEISAWKRVQKSFIRSAHPISTFLEIYLYFIFFQETACVLLQGYFHTPVVSSSTVPASTYINPLANPISVDQFLFFL